MVRSASARKYQSPGTEPAPAHSNALRRSDRPAPFLCRSINVARGVDIHQSDAKPDDKVRPDRKRLRCDEPGCYNDGISEHIIACGKEGRAGQAASVIAVTCQHKGAAQIDCQCARAGKCEG